MARAVRSNPVKDRTNRLKLDVGGITFVAVGDGLSLGYRRTQAGNGTWQARLWTGEKYVKHTLGEADDFMGADGDRILTFNQAQEKARVYVQEAKATPTGKPVTVDEAAKGYLEWYAEHRRAYRETEATVNAHILPTWGDKLLIDITAPNLRRWHEKLAAQPARKRTGQHATKQAHRDKAVTSDEKRARKSTANRILTVFKAILNRAFRDGLASDDKEWRKVKPFENADEPVTRFLKDTEATRLINACHADFRPLVKAALFTGCRYGELARLQTKDVNTDTGLIYITGEAKSGKGRHIPLSAGGLDFMQTAIAGKTGAAYVFTRTDGEPWGKNHHVRLLRAACEQAKIEPAIGFHDLRHTYASLLAQAGADLLTISKLLGHADTRITSRHYAHLCDKTLATAVRTLLPSFGHVSDRSVATLPSRKTA